MNVLTYKRYSARVEFEAGDGLFVGHIAGINDIVGFHAVSVDELKAAFCEAVDDYLDTCERAGRSPDKPF
jgi:predicted HicB family RNase H-like nuclease